MLKYEIEGGNLPVVICYPEAGQTICSESGAMSWMSPNMEMKTSSGGGFKKVKAIKDCDIDGNNISVDCSTCINRSIDGSTSGATQSGYFDYQSRALMRITPQSKSIILRKHANVDNPLYSYDQMEDILDSILLHQSGHSSNENYNARAKLIFHNADVFRRYANS